MGFLWQIFTAITCPAENVEVRVLASRTTWAVRHSSPAASAVKSSSYSQSPTARPRFTSAKQALSQGPNAPMETYTKPTC